MFCVFEPYLRIMKSIKRLYCYSIEAKNCYDQVACWHQTKLLKSEKIAIFRTDNAEDDGHGEPAGEGSSADDSSDQAEDVTG